MQLFQVILEGGGGGAQSLIFLALIILVFYLFFIRPQTKKNKELKRFRENLEKGQKIVSIGGIHGKIVNIGETTVTIEVEDQVRLKMEKAAVSNEYKDEGQMAQRK